MALLNEHARDPSSIVTIVKLADICISREDWIKAKEYISKAIRLQPDDFENIDALAEVFRREGKQEERDRLLKEYRQRYPETLDGYRLRIEEVSEKDPAKAKLLLSQAVKKFPHEGGFVFSLGVISQREGKLREAEEHFVRAAELSPNSAHIQAWVGRFFYKVKQDERRALKEESQLLRFDAVSALIMEGDADGRAIVSEHLPRESHPKLRKLIASAIKPGGPE